MWILVVIICLPLIWTLFPSGFFASHDGAYHLVRLVHFYKEIEAGQFPVRIGTDLAYGYGYPVFNYNYPLANYLGSLLHYLGFNFGESIKIIIILATIISILFYYLWLKCEFKKWPSLVGSILAAYIPYRLVAMYVTGSIGIVLSFVFLPMILWSVTTFIKSGKFAIFVVMGISGLILSHNVSALIYLPVIVLYSLVLIFREKKIEKLKSLFLMTILALGMSAFFLIPALFEMKYVNLSKGIAVNYLEHFPSFRELLYSPWNYGYSNGVNGGMSFQVGVAQWIVIILVFVLFSWFIIRGNFWKKENLLPITLLVIFVFTILVMLSLSEPLWKVFPIIRQVQFPWRLLALIMPIGAYLGAWLVLKLRWWIGILLITFAFYGNRNHLRTWEVVRYSDDFYITQTNLFFGSTDIAWESLPVWANGKIPTGFAKNIIEERESLNFKEEVAKRGERFRLVAESKEKQKVVVNLLYFPNWKIYANNQLLNIKPTENGLIEVEVPEGNFNLIAKLESTAIQTLANWISLVSIAIWLIWIIFQNKFFLFQHRHAKGNSNGKLAKGS